MVHDRAPNSSGWIRYNMHFSLVQTPTHYLDTTSLSHFPFVLLLTFQIWTQRSPLWNKKHPDVEAYASGISIGHPIPFPCSSTHDLVAFLWGLTKWQTERGGRLAAGHIRNALRLSQVTQTGNRLSLMIVPFVYFRNKSSARHLISLSLLGKK